MSRSQHRNARASGMTWGGLPKPAIMDFADMWRMSSLDSDGPGMQYITVGAVSWEGCSLWRSCPEAAPPAPEAAERPLHTTGT